MEQFTEETRKEEEIKAAETASAVAAKRKKKRLIGDYVVVAAMAVLMALNYDLFIVKNRFAPSGLNGVATMIEYITGGSFSIAYMSLLINIPLCIFAYFFTEKEFALKTFVFCVIYSAVYFVLQKTAVLARFRYDAGGADTIYPVLISGMIGGVVYGGAFRRNGSTGGTDIVSKYLSKKNPHLNFFWVLFAINATVAAASYFVYTSTDPVTGATVHNYKPVCMCILYSFISSFMANRSLQGGKSAYKFLIITKHAEEIDREIVEKLKHSATKLIGTGVYSNTERDVVICVVSKHQIVDFENIIRKYPDTFAFVETVNETIGNFKQVKRRADDSFYYVDEA
ncbi:MAG: YitT family protein [Clostridiales bacterium]|nr:YitT family protein [Clostridiales bacterium]MDY4894663.1 YitT family protein [Christensenellaceae bacterium]